MALWIELREKIPIAIAILTFEDGFSWECATPNSPSPKRPLPMSENCGGAESAEPTPTTLRSRRRFLGASAEEEEETTAAAARALAGNGPAEEEEKEEEGATAATAAIVMRIWNSRHDFHFHF